MNNPSPPAQTTAEKIAEKLASSSPSPAPSRFQVFKLDKRAQTPTRANLSDVGWDIYAHLLTESGRETSRQIPRYNASAIETKLVLLPPPGFYIQICSRSGWALQAVFVANAPGIIDPGYRGELKIILYNGSTETKFISHGQRIAQAILCPISPFALEETSTLPEEPSTDRGTKSFASSGY